MLDSAPLPDLTEAEPIPAEAWPEIETLLRTGDLFRYTAPSDAPVALLEREFARKLGIRYALAVSSCSAALFLALKALDLPPDAPVLIPAFTFAAVPSAVLHAGCRPVLVEVGADLRIDLADFDAKLDGAPAAVLISHMRGHTSDMDHVLGRCDALGIPVIEDAAHSLGTLWHDRPIGTLGRIGCYSFQSYKMLNAGEGGMLVSDDADLIARAVIMSGAYEQNWRKHDGVEASMARWQNRLPLYNTRLGNLSAALIRPQLEQLERRVTDGRRNHDHMAARLMAAPQLRVPPPLPPESRAPDSIQFTLEWMDPDRIAAFLEAARGSGLPLAVFGRTEGNARAFWNWQFLPEPLDRSALPRTRDMLVRCCDLRLPARLTRAEIDRLADEVLRALDHALSARA